MTVRTLGVIYITVLGLFALAGPGHAQERGYLGPLPCAGECHQEIFDTWKTSKHAKAFQNLAPGAREKEKKEAGLKPATDYTMDKTCMPCHVTGWNDGGYSMEKPDPYLQGVGCESCHGAAGGWNEIHKKKDLANRPRTMKQKGQIEPFKGRTVCVPCHEDDTNPYKFRTPPGKIDWTELKHADTYHILK
ncbi:MAG: cytochrome c family protein [Nitrospinota bacterium]|nr:cytochrome c family protein [Nitrospinota bacterium]MDH5679482.1 cytochrome c family protein [Nitrospinota bacterium]MDH5755609.1 cytochrome c family protein [Nitrospinota bacterium]